ncbi:YitT family protein [Bacillus marasmi]|uniref:YitT family protein n=1 Tax=Bacillus marasmi TaxID=1926279 RepID=UPI0011CB4542|nr:YitT family protein [Bacillus marasmi]
MYDIRLAFYNNYSRSGNNNYFEDGLGILLGATLVAISLQCFLIKNHIIDGGIVGISVLISSSFPIPIGILLLLLNIPFLLLGYFYIGTRFVCMSLYANLSLAIGTYILEPFPPITISPLIAIVIGGFLLGFGVGLIIRYGGSLDGTEIVAIILSKRLRVSIGQIVMLINFFIFSSAVMVFGLKEALYSLATFVVVYQTIDFSINK